MRPAAFRRLRSMVRAFSAGPDALTRDMADVLEYAVELEAEVQRLGTPPEARQTGFLLCFKGAEEDEAVRVTSRRALEAV